MRKQMTLAASVAQASMMTPNPSYRARSRLSPLIQLIVTSPTHRAFPNPLPCGDFLLAIWGSMPSQRKSPLLGSLS
jgi:hypothetical protein